MSAEQLVAGLGLPLATFVWCAASGIVPLVNAEVFLVAAAALTPSSQVWTIVALGTAGQMAAKAFMYLAGRGVFRVPLWKRKLDLEAVRARVARWRSRDLLVFVSAAVGLPPFYAIAILAGTLRFPFPRFLAFGLLGRLVRFSLLAAVPPVGRWIAGGGG